MATNKPYGDGHRNGAIKHRSQFEHPNGHFVKRNRETGQFMGVKSDEHHKFKGVRQEH